MFGPISCTSKNGDKINCNRVPVEKAGSQNLGKHHFCVINEVKDTGIKDMVNKISHVDFTESVQPRKFDKMLNLSDELSWEYQKFLRLMDNKVRMATISYHFHFNKEINIGQATGYK